jgi:ATP adenylyltransferase
MSQHLWTPWRMAYIKGEKKPLEGCVFCDKRDPANDAVDFIVARSDYVYVVLNIYPYNNGHVMIVPYEHVHSQEDLGHDALVDSAVTTNRALAVLRKVYNPPAFNIGANIGAAAGAGIAAHYHFHIVPRWAGDANFMSVVGDTRVIPDTLENVHRDLKAAWAALY